MEEQLIEAVRAFPVLYDTSHPDYFRAKLKQDLWESIAKDLNLLNGVLAKSAWEKLRNNHRDALRRQRIAMRSGSAADVIKVWKFQKQMEFLLTFMTNRQRETNLDDDTMDDSQPLNTENEDPLNTEKEDESFLLEEENEENLHNSIQDPELVELQEAFSSCYYTTPKTGAKRCKKQDLTSLLKQSILGREKRAKERALERKKIEDNAAPKEDLYHFFMSVYEDNKPPAMQLDMKIIVFNEVAKKKAELLNVQLPHVPVTSAPQHLEVQPQTIATTSSSNLVHFINNFVP